MWMERRLWDFLINGCSPVLKRSQIGCIGTLEADYNNRWLRGRLPARFACLVRSTRRQEGRGFTVKEFLWLLVAMAFSRSSVALLCVCIGVLLLVNVSAVEQQEVKAENADSTTQQFYLRGNTIGAMLEGTPLTEDTAEGSADSFATVDVNDYTPGPNCRPKPCHRR